MPTHAKYCLDAPDIYSLSLHHRLPFAAYRIPGEAGPHVILQLNGEVANADREYPAFDSKGFVITPFTPGRETPAVVIAPDINFKGHELDLSGHPHEDKLISLLDAMGQTQTEFSYPDPVDIHEAGFEEYADGVRKIKDAIEKKVIVKAVLSRILLQETSPSFSPLEFFNKLSAVYPSAFVYIFHIPGIGCWMGASPELLLSTDGHYLETVSLAGTQKTGSSQYFSWEEKELDEQQIVTNHIRRCLEKYCENIQIAGPDTVLAGPVAHLKTVFRANMKGLGQPDKLDRLIRELHPTPAVSGEPVKEAMDLIKKLENHARQYYTGFLGPVNLHNKTQLFINLRCMQIFKNSIAIYVGAGITSGSDPKSEWEETGIKAASLLNILNIRQQYAAQQ